MGKRNRKDRDSRGSSDKDTPPAKINKDGGQVSVSDTLHSANAVLFDNISLNESVFAITVSEIEDANMASMATVSDQKSSRNDPVSEPSPNPTSAQSVSCDEIMKILKQIDSRIVAIDKRLSTLDKVEKQVSSFDSELKKLRTLVYDNYKEQHEKTNKLTDELDGLKITMAEAQSEISKLKEDKAKIEDNLLYVQSQSMRNNLVFANITESAHEKPEDCEKLIRQLMVEKLQLAQDVVDKIGFERVHRMPMDTVTRQGSRDRPRNIVAKFSSFKDREMIRRAKGKLKGTNYFIYEQFPKNIADRRKSLIPKLKQALRDGKKAWLSYDTLYVDGRPVRDTAR